MSLEIKNLSKAYGTQYALQDISLSIGKGEIVGLLGPNGAGKSTLMKSIAGALPVAPGHIFFDGKDISAHAIEGKRKTGFLPENNPLYADMYVPEYLEFAAEIHGVPRARIREVAEETGVAPEMDKKVSQLSKGYRQRLGLAAAILHRPELLILDEPTNGLDPNQILEMRQVIRSAGHHKTVLLSTHIMQEVEALCSRVVLINKGKIVQDSPITDFRAKFGRLEDAFAFYTAADAG